MQISYYQKNAERLRQYAKERYLDPVIRARNYQSYLKYLSKPEVKERYRRNERIRYHKNPHYKEKQRLKILKKRGYKPSIREHASICYIENCGKPYKSKGLCVYHYKKKWYNENVPKKPMKPKLSDEEKRLKRREYNRNSWHNNPKRREYCRIYQRSHPRAHHKYSLDLQIAMINVRIRDNNTCKWFGCRLSHYWSRIEVHHIFPRALYPELELVEQYMICYCAEHHRQWHKVYHKQNLLRNHSNSIKLPVISQ